MNNKKNFFSALLYQLVHIIYGLLVPRIIILYFGSEINGLVSSITQFLSFISLLEGGLGAVVLSELYKPIECRDKEKVRRILKSSQALFNTISLVYIIYTIILGIGYGITSANNYSFLFVLTLTLILSTTTLAEYLCSITYRLYLQADQRIYITNYLSAAIMGLNILVIFISVKIFPEIRLLKLLSSIAFFIQPIILKHFVPKEFRIFRKISVEEYKISDRWNGFAQNLAHFINMNTDIILITVFCSYSEVSVYTVYMLAINALRLIVSTIANSYQSALGKYITQNNTDVINQKFYKFSIAMSGISTTLFCTCLLLINQFVNIYITSVNDVDYFRPIFAVVILVANLIYCIREPFRLLILAAGKFKETNFGSILEAILNVGISIILIKKYGIVGVAVGTFVAMIYRMIYFICFLRKSVINLDVKKYMITIVPVFIVLCINVYIYFWYPFSIDSIIKFIVVGVVTITCESVLTFILYFFSNKVVSRI